MYIYFIYEFEFSEHPVYIGMTNNPDRRMVEHFKSGKVFSHIKYLKVSESKGYQARELAYSLENFLIIMLRPAWNDVPHNYPFTSTALGNDKIIRFLKNGKVENEKIKRYNLDKWINEIEK